MITIVIVAIVLISLFAFVANTVDNPDEKEMERLKEEYESTLLGANKKAALKAGRLYYAAARKDKKLTIFDELTIANDLSVMANHGDPAIPVNNDTVEVEFSQSSASTAINF